MRLALSLVLVFALAAIGLVPTSAFAQTRTLTVSPNTNLLDGQEVAVAGSGFAPNVSVAFCEGVQTPTPSQSTCGTGLHLTATDAAGSFSGKQVLERFISVPALGTTVDCANPATPCVIGAAEISDIAGTATYAALQFAPVPPRLDAGLANVREGNSGTTDVAIPVHLSLPWSETVTAQWQTVVLPNYPFPQADPSNDYTPASGTVTFAPGQTEQSVIVSVNGDVTIDDLQEDIVVQFTNPTNATIGQGIGVGVILDDDTRIDASSASVSEGNSGATDLAIPVRLSPSSGDTVTVQWHTFVPDDPNAADPSSDYTPASGTLTFAPGQTQQYVHIAVNGDVANEPNELIGIQLTDATNATINQAVGYGTIRNDDTPPRIDPGRVTVAEGNSGTTDLVIPVRLSKPWRDTVTVEWRTIFGTGLASAQADPASDYTAANGTLTFEPGQTVQNVHIAVHGDIDVEPDEYLIVALSNATNATIGGLWGLTFASIRNDDAPPRIDPGSATVAEGDSGTTDLVVPVSLSKPSVDTVTVDWRTIFGTGLAGAQADPASDYTAANGTLTFAPGQTAQNVHIAVHGDVQVEPDEYLALGLSNATNATIGGLWGLTFVFIRNDD